MKKTIKNIFKNILVCIVSVAIAAAYTTSVNAAESETGYDDIAVPVDVYLEPNYDDSHDYFMFHESVQRMDDSGNFTFSFKDTMVSDSFIPAASTIKVTVTAKSSNSDSDTFTIRLCKWSDDFQVGSVKYTANGTAQAGTFSNLSTDTRYYLSFTRPIFQNAKITGSGTVTPIK